MNSSLQRTFLVLPVVVMLGCGSDGSHKDPLTTDSDASTADAGEPHKPDASRTDLDASMGSEKDATPPKDAQADAEMDAGLCGGATCVAPATCSQGEKPHCACPAGYDDPKGDGSQCTDKDECAKPDTNNCGKHAKCENKPGSFTCTCQAPAYKGDGKTCACADGYAESDGLCLANDGQQCADNLDCIHAHCQSGICCAQACSSPGAECLSIEKATCQDGHTCQYPVAADDAACDDSNACTTTSSCKSGHCMSGATLLDCNDKNPCTEDSCDTTVGCKNPNNTAACDDGNPCTENDTCSGGSCSSVTPKHCESQNDSCNMGTCSMTDGSCIKVAVADGTLCSDTNTCTANEMCSAGSCTGANACGVNATSCTAGTPNTCACASGFKSDAAQCVPDTDECSANPCAADAKCLDVSSNPGDVTCTCNPGFDGDGKTCVEHNGCANNPCGEGRGTCVRAPLGAYTCTCGAGFREVLGQCVCDLQGTFAVRSELNGTWPAQTGIEAGSATSYTWTLGRYTYDAQGNLDMSMTACGETDVDLCGTGSPPLVPVEAYAQYVPRPLADPPPGQPSLLHMNLPAALPTTIFKSPVVASLVGISLTDPLGDWPATYKDVQGGPDFDGTAVNGARWIDSDNDGVIGVTTYAVGPGGVVADGSATAPAKTYPALSPTCPRMGDPNAARSPYNYPPAADGLQLRRVKRFFSANRMVSGFDGKLETCKRITGAIVGPDTGNQYHFDARIGGCVRVNGNDETACSASVVNFNDSSAQSNGGTQAATFIMKRVDDTVTTCAQVRAVDFSN